MGYYYQSFSISRGPRHLRAMSSRKGAGLPKATVPSERSRHSARMSRVRSRGNRTTEMAFVQILRTENLTGWRRHLPLLGKPDFTFPSSKVAIFIDGCFWHACPKCNTMPASNVDFWIAKFEYNRRR